MSYVPAFTALYMLQQYKAVFALGQGCLTHGPRSCFVWPARYFYEVDFLMERLTISLQIKSRMVWIKTFFCLDFAKSVQICGKDLFVFFLVFTYVWGQISIILAEAITNLWQKSLFFFGVHLSLGANSRNTGRNHHQFAAILLRTDFQNTGQSRIDFVLQTCNYLEFNLCKMGLQSLFSCKCGPHQ